MNCLHVRVTATREQLHDMGVCSEETFNMLLSRRAMPVQKKETVNGRVMVYLDHPTDPARDLLLWVYEEYTEPI